MGNRYQHRPLSRLAPLALVCLTGFAASPVKFEIKLDPAVATRPVAGRLLILMSPKAPQGDRIQTGFTPGETWIAATEIESWKPGDVVALNPDLKASPAPFSTAKPGDYWFMATLDPDHSYVYHGQDAGDLYGPVVKRAAFSPADGGTVELVLNHVAPQRKLADTDSVKLVEFVSPMLSAFWGRPITMHAGVVLPPSYSASTGAYPTVFNVHGFGGDHTAAWRTGPGLVKQMKEGKRSEMINVFLDASFPTGHHVFADSVNNGPWGRALTQEFIPYLEKHFKMVGKPYGRFLTGHSSGGWSTLWLQVAYPDFFGGTWSTSPDASDFRSFSGINLTPGGDASVYTRKDGVPFNIARFNGKNVASLEEFTQQEETISEYGGQIASFDWVFSPRGPDGRPQKFFNRATGEINPVVTKAWEKYDIRLILATNWETLGPKLGGKIHIVVGDEDNFHLEEPAHLTCEFLKSKGEDVCEFVPGRDHMNLYNEYKTYPEGLQVRIDQQMKRTFDASKSRAAGASN